jgi:hypothetical protein
MATYEKYIHGAWNVICDRCGFKFKNFQCKMEWTGFFVCEKCWEPRHPQEFLRGVTDNQSVPISRPEPTDVFVDTSINPPDLN